MKVSVPFTKSVTCRTGGHGFCSGRRFVRLNGGYPIYGKCQCSCHRAAA